MNDMNEDGFMARMEKEGRELEARLTKLNDFLTFVNAKNPVDREEYFKQNNIDDGDLDLMQAQATAMATYANVLRIRFNIARIKRQLPTIAQF